MKESERGRERKIFVISRASEQHTHTHTHTHVHVADRHSWPPTNSTGTQLLTTQITHALIWSKVSTVCAHVCVCVCVCVCYVCVYMCISNTCSSVRYDNYTDTQLTTSVTIINHHQPSTRILTRIHHFLP